MQDAQEDEDGVFFFGADICPNADDAILSYTKFYREPLGMMREVGFEEIYSLYRDVDCKFSASDRKEYTHAAIQGSRMIADVSKQCLYSWKERERARQEAMRR